VAGLNFLGFFGVGKRLVRQGFAAPGFWAFKCLIVNGVIFREIVRASGLLDKELELFVMALWEMDYWEKFTVHSLQFTVRTG
jgi:hypothetical protein